jgi:hypothetical protein
MITTSTSYNLLTLTLVGDYIESAFEIQHYTYGYIYFIANSTDIIEINNDYNP